MRMKTKSFVCPWIGIDGGRTCFLCCEPLKASYMVCVLRHGGDSMMTAMMTPRVNVERKLAIIEMFANVELPGMEGDLSDEEIVEQERLCKAGEPE